MSTEITTEKKEVSQSYWSLVWWKFRRNRLALIGGVIVIIFYVVCALGAEFFSPYLLERQSDFLSVQPQRLQFFNEDGSFAGRPYVYGLEEKIDMVKRLRTYEPNLEQKIPLHFFVKGEPYKLMGLIPWDVHLYGAAPCSDNNPTALECSPEYSHITEETQIFIFGSDRLGRDMLSRIIYGGRLSLLIGLIGQFMTLFLGSILGAASGYYGGAVDMAVMRTTEFLSAFPDIPLFMALAAAIPPTWNPIWIYFMLTIILAFVRWGGLARQVRGLVLSLREREYVLAAQSFGASDGRIMFRHLIPGAFSHIIVISTLAIPGMILAETALSFLGLGLRPPLTSWGVLLQEASTVRVIRFSPWVLLPVPFVVTVVLGFNMLGDGLRDALDPYGGQ